MFDVGLGVFEYRGGRGGDGGGDDEEEQGLSICGRAAVRDGGVEGADLGSRGLGGLDSRRT